jgi:hypothetical protein
VPANRERNTSTPTPFIASITLEDDDTIVVDPKSLMEDDKDDEIPDIPTPTFEDTTLTEEEKLAAITKWKIHRQKYEHKPRDKTSHVYFYIRKRLLPKCLFSEIKREPNIL